MSLPKAKPPASSGCAAPLLCTGTPEYPFFRACPLARSAGDCDFFKYTDHPNLRATWCSHSSKASIDAFAFILLVDLPRFTSVLTTSYIASSLVSKGAPASCSAASTPSCSFSCVAELSTFHTMTCSS